MTFCCLEMLRAHVWILNFTTSVWISKNLSFRTLLSLEAPSQPNSYRFNFKFPSSFRGSSKCQLPFREYEIEHGSLNYNHSSRSLRLHRIKLSLPSIYRQAAESAPCSKCWSTPFRIRRAREAYGTKGKKNPISTILMSSIGGRSVAFLNVPSSRVQKSYTQSSRRARYLPSWVNGERNRFSCFHSMSTVAAKVQYYITFKICCIFATV